MLSFHRIPFRLFTAIAVVSTVFVLSGCNTARKKNPEPEKIYLTRFYLEADQQVPPNLTTRVKMPLSETEVVVGSRPFLTESNIVNVELVQVEVGPPEAADTALALAFYFDRNGTSAFFPLTANNVGKRILLTINSQPVGLMPIQGPVSTGEWLTFTELKDEQMPETITALRETTTYIQTEIEADSWLAQKRKQRAKEEKNSLTQ